VLSTFLRQLHGEEYAFISEGVRKAESRPMKAFFGVWCILVAIGDLAVAAQNEITCNKSIQVLPALTSMSEATWTMYYDGHIAYTCRFVMNDG
jgi:hypothetical protein